MKIGVVGLGFMGLRHLQAYRELANCQVEAVVSSDERKLAGDFSAVGGNLETEEGKVDLGAASRYRTAIELFSDPSVDAVDLCVPTDLHRQLTEEALNAGKHVLVEKPMALSGADCRAMISTAEQNDRVLMVAHVLRFWPDYVKAREIVSRGTLGRVRAATFSRRCAAPDWAEWMSKSDRSGGGAFDLLIHDFDYCIHLLGMPAAVSVVGVEEMLRGTDYLQADLQFESVSAVSISGGWMPGQYPFSMEFTVVCEDGTLNFHSDIRPLTLFRRGQAPEVMVPEGGDGYQAELQAFVDACAAGSAPSNCPPQESTAAVELTLAALKSRRLKGKLIPASGSDLA